jgi:hypothetical protein
MNFFADFMTDLDFIVFSLPYKVGTGSTNIENTHSASHSVARCTARLA